MGFDYGGEWMSAEGSREGSQGGGRPGRELAQYGARRGLGVIPRGIEARTRAVVSHGRSLLQCILCNRKGPQMPAVSIPTGEHGRVDNTAAQTVFSAADSLPAGGTDLCLHVPFRSQAEDMEWLILCAPLDRPEWPAVAEGIKSVEGLQDFVDALPCQRSSRTPHWRPSELPARGHENSPREDMEFPTRSQAPFH